jgi:glycosyltransferase involved in cell wall biosynthesis
MKSKILSIIIPVYNPGEEFLFCLEAVFKQLDYVLEIIIIDDGSSRPIDIAQTPTLRVLRHELNLGPSFARNTGLHAAKSDYLVFIDSDIIIPDLALSTVVKDFEKFNDKKYGMTCAKHVVRSEDQINFLTLYKELYMNYVFSSQKENIDFLYGGFCAFKRPHDLLWPCDVRYGEDTYMGQLLFEDGYKIKLMNDLEIKHIKNYTLKSFLRHSFLVAFHFNQSLMAKKTASLHHSHATFHQLMSITLIFLVCLNLILGHLSLILIFLILWMMHNFQFITFLRSQLSFLKTLLAIALTLLDQFVKGAGIFFGLIFFGSLHQLKKRKLIQSPSEYRGNK